jgi:hypothetical protein
MGFVTILRSLQVIQWSSSSSPSLSTRTTTTTTTTSSYSVHVFAQRLFTRRKNQVLNELIDDGDESLTQVDESNSDVSNNTMDAIELITGQYVWLMLLLSYIVLPPVSNKQLQVFDCIELESGERYLRENTSIDCRSKEYYKFRSIVIVFLILYQSIPIIWMCLLCRHIKVLSPMSMKYDEKLALFTRDNNPDLSYLKFLFIDYKCNKWWFEVAEMYRRIIFIGILPLVSPRAATRASFGLLFGFFGAVYFIIQEPYRVEFTNVIAFVAQVVLMLHHVFFIALIISKCNI